MKRRAGELADRLLGWASVEAGRDAEILEQAAAILRAVADGMLDRKHGVLVIAAPGGQGGGDGRG